MIQAKLITSTTPAEFDRDLNQELSQLKNVVDVKFSTAVTNHPDSERTVSNDIWDTIYSAIILYKNG